MRWKEEQTWKTFLKCWLLQSKVDNAAVRFFRQETLTMSARLVVSLRPLTRGLTTSPSKAYTDNLREDDPAVRSTPGDLTPAERVMVERALRVDQAGEIAANYIYKGQMTVLSGDPRVANLIRVCSIDVSQFHSIRIPNLPGHVGAREETPPGHGQITAAAWSATNFIVGCCKGSWICIGCRHCSYGKGSCNGMHRGSGNSDRGTLRRVRGYFTKKLS